VVVKLLLETHINTLVEGEAILPLLVFLDSLMSLWPSSLCGCAVALHVPFNPLFSPWLPLPTSPSFLSLHGSVPAPPSLTCLFAFQTSAVP
jgi:hypothetical protein